ncbi:MAG: hypothetical protein GF398_03175, partial [Chitinivibrionales bacterium]|nr:hypothetical protein [Chitinivibrionales bacterium]
MLLSGQASAKYETQYGNDFGDRILRVTQGEDFKVVWGREGQTAYWFKGLMMYDSKEGKLMEAIENIRQWRQDPQRMQDHPDIRPAPNGLQGRYNYVSPMGNKIVFNIKGFPDPN